MLKRAHVRQFLAVVDTGSFTHAAARIRLTQPTLSAGIAELERNLGHRVFVRDRKGVHLTETGARLLPIARAIENGFTAIDKIGEDDAEAWPALRLGLLKTLAKPVARRVLSALPDSLEVIDGSNAELRKALASGRVDMIVTTLARHDRSTNAIPILDEPYEMFVSAAHRLAGTERVSPHQLGGEVMIARRSCEALHETSRFFTRHGIRPRFALRSHDEDLCMQMVALGRGITIAPHSYKAAGIVPVWVEGYEMRRTLGIITDTGNETTSTEARNSLHDAIAAAILDDDVPDIDQGDGGTRATRSQFER
ncbi:LysR family transcriptional regulator [Novosphingobium malaysiense]|uniref:LysR family transcriptional regulator n=1 Tax=Novosphingobium malaysiense TaxID=1348853 RepID=UPI0006909E2C|nr:LysR family transcriptional regulator [Novosphingobium malaysiense]